MGARPSAALYCPLRSHPDAGADTPSTHFTADVNMSFLTLLRRAALTLLLALLPAVSGWACTPVFVRGQASTLRLNVGQLTVPADAQTGHPAVSTKSFAWNRLSGRRRTAGSAARTTRTDCRRCCWTVCCPAGRRDRRFIKPTSPALAFAYRCALSAAMAAFLTGRRPRRLANG